MKLKKSELRKMVREAVQNEVVSIAREQKNLSECVKVYLEEAPFLAEHKEINSRKALLEFFGPFKRLKTADIEKMGKEKDVKQLVGLAKDAEKARKGLGSIKLTNVNAVEIALENYIEKLTDLWSGLREAEVDEQLKSKLSKPFAAAAYTLQSLSASLADAANDLFSAVPRASGVYSAGREAGEIESSLKAAMKGPGDVARDIASLGASGMGVGRGPRG